MEATILSVRTILAIPYRCGLLALSAVALALLHLSVRLERYLRTAIPPIIAALPPEYRYLLAWITTPPRVGKAA